jgi:small GTP-binding protein
MAEHDKHYRETLAALRRLSGLDLRENERVAVAPELDEIDTMVEKLEHGVVEIAAFGEVNSGKSSLLNALLGRPAFAVAATAGRTRELSRQDWTPSRQESKGFADSRLVMVDTPGINEVEGDDRAAIAEATIRYADIVLFVTYGDLNDIEFSALKALRTLHKPIILVINKIDLFKRRELEETVASIRRKVGGMIGEADIVFAAGDPAPVLRLYHNLDGSVREEWADRAPIIEDLSARILEILQREGKAVVALNANLFASEVSERIALLKATLRAEEAEKVIRRFMAIKALAVALNPIPLADIAGGMVADVVMVQQLGAVYGQPFSRENARSLVTEILGAWGIMVSFEWVTHLAAGVMKGTAPLVGHALVAIPQALAAAWTTYIVGKAASVYFRQGGWGGRGAKAILRDILSGVDRDSVLQPLKDELLRRLGAKTT